MRPTLDFLSWPRFLIKGKLPLKYFLFYKVAKELYY